MKDFQYITNAHPSYIENLYNDFVKDPQSVDNELRKFFEGFDFAVANAVPAASKPSVNGHAAVGNLQKEFAVFQLIQAYRKKGHLVAKTNPIRERKDRKANLDLMHFGL
ncbi:MAG TPA: 2-oxoglutarate dehydrogenase E1 component, partial [Ferruginibacter sp.]|nr:2-oxoglutarate dehydrogenase E1 component [Ferruginibacter sp.]